MPNLLVTALDLSHDTPNDGANARIGESMPLCSYRFRYGRSVRTWIGGRVIRSGLRIVQDRLAAAHFLRVFRTLGNHVAHL